MPSIGVPAQGQFQPIRSRTIPAGGVIRFRYELRPARQLTRFQIAPLVGEMKNALIARGQARKLKLSYLDLSADGTRLTMEWDVLGTPVILLIKAATIAITVLSAAWAVRPLLLKADVIMDRATAPLKATTQLVVAGAVGAVALLLLLNRKE